MHEAGSPTDRTDAAPRRSRGRVGRTRRLSRATVLTAVVALVASGCLYYPSAERNAAVQPQPRPWWCTSNVGSDLSLTDCTSLSAQLDVALDAADSHWHASQAIADGATAGPYVTGTGSAFAVSPPASSFNPATPDTYLYAGTDPTSQLAGLEWNVIGASPPAGFAGDNDQWTETSTDVWTLNVWIVRGFENEPDVFASTQPCLAAGGAIFDTTAACYTSTHTHPLQVLVTNDDGYAAPGIDAAVQALLTVPGVDVTVVAPATDQSGTGGKTTPGGVTAFSATTASGYPATAVNGYPSDSVLYALHVLHLNPDLVVSGINNGQNIGPFVAASGTVGAARTGASNAIPALAASVGAGSPDDFPSAATAVLTWVNEFRLGQAGPPYQVVANLNVPTCTSGSIRGWVDVPVATSLHGRPFTSNCASTVSPSTFVDDVDGFDNGYITLSDAGLGS